MNINIKTKDLLFLDRMITPQAITIVYWVTMAVVVFFGVIKLFSALIHLSLVGILLGILYIIIGMAVTRISFELLIVMFKIHDNVKKIADDRENG